MDNKLTGSFYTPKKLIEYMVQYAQRRIKPRNILEPSAGDGRFVEPLREFNCPISLVELEKQKATRLNKLYADRCDVYCCDFLKFAIEHEKHYDLIIGNPPYISKKSLTAEQREVSLKIIKYFELDEGLFQNTWVSFILASLKLLSPNGAIFFVLPFEFLQVQYAEKLRGFLETKFNTIEITTFENRVFTEIEQDVCLVYLSNKVDGTPYINYTTLVSETNLTQTFQSVIMRNKPLKKWSNCILNDEETEALSRLASKFSHVYTFGEISPGIVTGANSFFILPKFLAEKLRLSDQYLLPILTKSSSIPPLLLFKQQDFESMFSEKTPTHLLNLNGLCKEDFSQELNDYIASGEQDKVNSGYKCNNRKRWYDVPIIKNGEVCFFKRYHQVPKIIVNQARIHTTDIIYNIRLKPEYDPASFAFCFYNSLTLALCEYSGRFYGGGVGELVPSEFKQLVIPYKKIDSRSIQKLDKLFRTNKPIDKIIDYIDNMVLSELSDNDILLLQIIRKRYVKRRLKRVDR